MARAPRGSLCRDRLAAIEAARPRRAFPEGGRGANEWVHARDAAAAALRSLEEALLGGAGVEFDACRGGRRAPTCAATKAEGADERAESPRRA